MAMETDRSPADFAFKETQEPFMGSVRRVLKAKTGLYAHKLGLGNLRHGHEMEIAAASMMNLSVPFFASIRV